MIQIEWMILAGVALGTWALAGLLAGSRFAAHLADHPNARSLHETPTPRVGGIALVLVALPAAAWHGGMPLTAVIAIAIALAALSAIDDARSLPVQVRLAAHLCAASAAILSFASPTGIQSAPGWVEAGIAILAVAWMTNLFNFMDGADGLAGGMGVLGFGALSLAAFDSGFQPLGWVAACVCCGCVGFLARNFPPARLFLGDAGSIPLGFLAGALGAAGVAQAAWPWWFPVLVFSPFVVDASVTLARRALRGALVWRAHREHAYQRLVLGGWTHRRLAISAYALMAACGASAILALRSGPEVRCAILFLWVAGYGLLLAAIEWREARRRAVDRQTPASGFGP